MDFFNIPLFIISYNRSETLQICLERFVKDGYKNIIIIDNASDNEAHINYLQSLSQKVYFLRKNYGHHVLWDCGLFDEIINNQYYVLTDPDILPIGDCPSNYVEEFYNILQEYPQKTKVGFSLKIDDLPENYIYKYDIVRAESFYWEKRLPYKYLIYDAPIDTTFALYRPGMINKDKFYEGIRTGDKYIARHLGWYIDCFNQSAYYQKANKSSTSMSALAMEAERRNVIVQLACRQKGDIYTLVRSMCSDLFVEEHVPWSSIVKMLMYLPAKKIKVNYKNRNKIVRN